MLYYPATTRKAALKVSAESAGHAKQILASMQLATVGATSTLCL